MKVVAIIPARYASSRFPGKPLADIGGKPMIRRVYEQVSRCVKVGSVYVATDDDRIADCVRGFGGNVCMTDPAVPNGTLRCWAAYRQIVSVTGMQDVLVNVQGDEPMLDPQALCSLLSVFEDKDTGIATLRKKIVSAGELFDPNVVKVVVDKDENALYFSRLPLPYQRELPGSFSEETAGHWLERCDYFKHVGLYAFRPEILSELVRLEPSPCERAENLEQLRWIESGYRVRAKETDYESYSVDVPADIEKIISLNVLN